MNIGLIGVLFISLLFFQAVMDDIRRGKIGTYSFGTALYLVRLRAYECFSDRVLGRGGFGEVYVVKSVTSGKELALKSLRTPEVRLVPGMLRRIASPLFQVLLLSYV